MTNPLLEKLKEAQTKKHADNMMKIGLVLSEVLDHLAPMFRPQTRLTFLARTPGRPDQDILVGNDPSFEDIRKMIDRSEARAKEELAGKAQLLPTRPAGLAKSIENIMQTNDPTDPPCCTTTTAQPVNTDCCGPVLDCNGMPIPGSTDPGCCTEVKTAVVTPCCEETECPPCPTTVGTTDDCP